MSNSSIAMPRAVIFIHADQHRADCLGIEGHPLLKTPNLDRIAREGMRFTHAFCPTPICVPARSSLLCGRWPLQHKVISNWDGESPHFLDDKLPTFARALTENNIHCDYIGHWHVHPQKTPLDFGFTSYTPEWEYDVWRRDSGIPKLQCDWRGGTDIHITPEQSQLTWLFDRAIERVAERSQNKTPFMLRLDCKQPHLPNRVPEPYASMYAPEDVKPWGSFEDTFEGKPYIQKQQLRTWKVEDYNWSNWQPIVARYLGEISLLDFQVGRLLNELERLDISDDTLIIYSCDHGDMCGAHRMVDKHYVMYEDVMRVPLLMRWPAAIKAGNICETFISNAIDLPPTFCDVFGVPIPEGFAGQSLLPMLRGEKYNGREDIYASWNGNQFGQWSQRMVRDRRWKYIWNATAEDELYDLENDPHELTNRATDENCRAELSRLRRRLVDWMEEIKDPLLNHWTRDQLLENRKI